MGQPRGVLSPEERARITELQDLLIERFVEHREATAAGQEARVKTVEAEIDSLLREKEDIEKWAAVGSAYRASPRTECETVLTPIRSLKIGSLRNERSASDRNAVSKNGLISPVF
jgi:hypothetical protein